MVDVYCIVLCAANWSAICVSDKLLKMRSTNMLIDLTTGTNYLFYLRFLVCVSSYLDSPSGAHKLMSSTWCWCDHAEPECVTWTGASVCLVCISKPYGIFRHFDAPWAKGQGCERTFNNSFCGLCVFNILYTCAALTLLHCCNHSN